MPRYDCGDPDCGECQLTFGPDRTDAIARYQRMCAAESATHAQLQAAYNAGVKAAAEVASGFDNCGTDDDPRHALPYEISGAIQALAT